MVIYEKYSQVAAICNTEKKVDGRATTWHQIRTGGRRLEEKTAEYSYPGPDASRPCSSFLGSALDLFNSF